MMEHASKPEQDPRFRFHREDSPEDYAAYKHGFPCGRATLTSDRLFWRYGVSLYSLPIGEIAGFRRRVDEVTSRTCCCSSDFSVHTLLLALKDGTQLSITLGDSFFRHEPEELCRRLALQCPVLPADN